MVLRGGVGGGWTRDCLSDMLGYVENGLMAARQMFSFDSSIQQKHNAMVRKETFNAHHPTANKSPFPGTRESCCYDQCSHQIVRRVPVSMDATFTLAWSTVDGGWAMD